MTVQRATQFIRHARASAAIREELAALGRDPLLADVVAIAVSAGFAIDEVTLRTAFRHDWTMRAVLAGSVAPSNRSPSDRASAV